MAPKILFVDDDVNILSGFQRNLRNRFQVATASSAEQGMRLLMAEPFAVVVSDYRMPKMNGVEFLAWAAAELPDCVRVLLTGEADTRAAVAAVNQGHIYRFLMKPCPALTLEKTLADALKHYDLITGEKQLLERTLLGSMEVLTEILNLVNPVAFSRADRLYRIVKQVLALLDLPDKWEFEIAAMLSHIGCITIPFEILDKVSNGKELTEKERALYLKYPATGARLLEKIPRLELVAQIIEKQTQPCPPIPPWQALEEADRLSLGCQLLALASQWDKDVSKGLPKAAILAELRTQGYPLGLLKAVAESGSAPNGDGFQDDFVARISLRDDAGFRSCC